MGSEHGTLYRILGPGSDPSVLTTYPTSAIFCLDIDRDGNLLYVGLEFGIDVVRIDCCVSIRQVQFPESVWSISTRPNTAMLVGLQYNGIAIVTLYADDIHVECRFPEIGTCSAISRTRNNGWYAASNRSRIYHCAETGELDSRYVADAILEPDDHSCIPRRDIYDVLVISHLRDSLRLLETGTLSERLVHFGLWDV